MGNHIGFLHISTMHKRLVTAFICNQSTQPLLEEMCLHGVGEWMGTKRLGWRRTVAGIGLPGSMLERARGGYQWYWYSVLFCHVPASTLLLLAGQPRIGLGHQSPSPLSLLVMKRSHIEALDFYKCFLSLSAFLYSLGNESMDGKKTV